LFIFFASGLWALLPAVARGPLGLDAGGYGLLLSSIGAGAVAGAFTVPALRARLGTNVLIAVATLVYAAAMLVLAFVMSIAVIVVALVGVGLAWVAVQSTLSATAQMLLPGWTRARALAYAQLVFMGGQALGAVAWGVVAEAFGLEAAFAVPAAALLAGTALAMRLLPVAATTLDVRPVRHLPEPLVLHEPSPAAGPVLVIVEYQVDPENADAFVAAMQPVGRARRRTGATLWGLFQDAEDPSLFLETFTVATWHEHLRQHRERGTAMDEALEAQARTLLRPGTEPRVRHLLWAYTPWIPPSPVPTREPPDWET
jgi:MFS family permease